MSVTSINQDNVDEHLIHHHQTVETKTDHEKWLRYKNLVKMGKISKDYIEDGIKMHVMFSAMKDADLDIVLEGICDKEHPLRELELEWEYGDKETVGTGFIEITKAIGTHTTLIRFLLVIFPTSNDNRTAILLEAIKENKSIKHLVVCLGGFYLETAHALAEALRKNKTLVSLKIFATETVPEEEHCNDVVEPMSRECVIELARSLQSTILEQLGIGEITTSSLEELLPSLPKTLVYLDLSNNSFCSEALPIFRSYLKSNDGTLKVLVLKDRFIKEDLQEQDMLSLSTAKIIDDSNWKADFFRKDGPLCIEPQKMNDSDWFMLFVELTKDTTTFREIDLCLPDEFDQNYLKYVKTLFSEQFRLTNVTISGNLSDTTIRTELFQQLKENNSVIKLRFVAKIDSNVFNELKNLLKNKNNIIHLELFNSVDIREDEVIMFCHALKTNTTLQSLTLNSSQIGDIGFQALLSSLPNSLTRLKVENNLITAKSLPPLFAFMKNAPNLNEISLKRNGISSYNLTEVNISELEAEILDIANANHCICNLDIQEKVKQQIAQASNDEIRISFRAFRDVDVLELSNELKKNPEQKWSLTLTDIGHISSVGFDCLAGILSSTTNIVAFDIFSNEYSEESSTKLCNGLCNNKTIKRFQIYRRKLDNQEMDYIGRFIQNNSALKQVRLSWCDIDDDGIIHLVKGLPGSSLEILELNLNSIGDRSCAALLSSIPPTLKYLSLDHNQITESTFQTIATFLTTNRTLKALGIRWNPITGESYDGAFDDIRWQQINEALEKDNMCKLI